MTHTCIGVHQKNVNFSKMYFLLDGLLHWREWKNCCVFIDLKSVCFRGPIEMCFVAFIAKVWHGLTMVRNCHSSK